MEKRELVCIRCPLGCMINVELENNEVKAVTGNTCKRGEEYAKKEVTAPTRTVTSTVKISEGDIPFVPVKTKEDIPKDKIFECMQEIRAVSVKAPVSIGDTIIENTAGTGIPVIAAKSVKIPKK